MFDSNKPQVFEQFESICGQTELWAVVPERLTTGQGAEIPQVTCQ
jgi:hypothetical protein